MASVSASARATSVDEIPGATVTLTVSATARAAISILPAIDGWRRRKFDVRNREGWDGLDLEIDRHDVIGQRHAELRDRDVARGLLVGVKRRPIDECDRKPGVVGSRRADDVRTNLQAGNSVYILQGRQPGAMVVLCGGIDVRLV